MALEQHERGLEQHANLLEERRYVPMLAAQLGSALVKRASLGRRSPAEEAAIAEVLAAPFEKICQAIVGKERMDHTSCQLLLSALMSMVAGAVTEQLAALTAQQSEIAELRAELEELRAVVNTNTKKGTRT